MKKKLKVVFVVVSIIILVLLFETIISYSYLQTNEFTYSSSKIEDSLSILVIADLHDHEFSSGNARLVSKIHNIHPDFILMAGDFLNANSKDSHVPVEFIENLGTDIPIYFSLGNHEIDYMNVGHPELIEELEQAGAIVLEKEYEDIKINDTTLRIGGMYDYAFGEGPSGNEAEFAKPEIKAFLEDFQNTDSLKIMMAHRPDSFVLGDVSAWDIDLVVSGHLHGGQVVVPFLGGFYAGDQGFFPEYIHGMYEKDDMNIFITSGLGSHTQLLPRFNNPPEIAVIHVGQDTK